MNSKGENLPDIRNSKNSLLNKLETSVGLVSPSINTFRRASEKIIQESALLSEIVPTLAGHSKEVGSEHYDRYKSTRRANYICQLEKVKTPKKPTNHVPDDVKEKRKVREAKELEQVVADAKEKLLVDKLKKSAAKSANFKIINPSDRDFMQRLFQKSFGQFKKFPSDDSWLKLFYREVDNDEDTNGDSMRGIEESVFIEHGISTSQLFNFSTEHAPPPFMLG